MTKRGTRPGLNGKSVEESRPTIGQVELGVHGTHAAVDVDSLHIGQRNVHPENTPQYLAEVMNAKIDEGWENAEGKQVKDQGGIRRGIDLGFWAGSGGYTAKLKGHQASEIGLGPPRQGRRQYSQTAKNGQSRIKNSRGSNEQRVAGMTGSMLDPETVQVAKDLEDRDHKGIRGRPKAYVPPLARGGSNSFETLPGDPRSVFNVGRLNGHGVVRVAGISVTGVAEVEHDTEIKPTSADATNMAFHARWPRYAVDIKLAPKYGSFFDQRKPVVGRIT
ncbi:hypothetical protein B0H17DRAFT_1130440 [Mycena rosella]|uniref:Uncharacterized protein n=1 Tax=Mycena rosella TaxID=1033263 RepID=A0AAD7DT56_MYCRO|nr:hypothetical protein B0H17DRAFT_1130440 [Mycena rosella]